MTTPQGTSGQAILPGASGSLSGPNGLTVALVNGEAVGLQGGSWTLQLGS